MCSVASPGVFVLALADDRREELVLARDAFGIKPLLYTTTQPFAFGSDAIALVAVGLNAGHLDERALAEYLRSITSRLR